MKRIVCFIACLIIMANGALAITINLQDSYLPGETVIGRISGNILEPITPDKVEFMRGHVLVPFDYDVKKVGDRYYIWFITPQNEMNYTLAVRGITTTVSGKIQQIDYEKNFSVSGNLSDYSVKPGFVLAEGDFEIAVQLNEDEEKSISVKFVEESDFTLKPGENSLDFSISAVNETKTMDLVIGKYTLPVYVRVNKTTITKPIEGNRTGLNLTNISEIDIEELNESEQEVINVQRAQYNCFEYPGNICAADETCSGNTIVSADGPCCVGMGAICKKGGGGSLAWIGYLLGAIVIIAGIFIWIKYKKTGAEKNPLEKKVQAFEKKML
jgi:hypothetical protein